MSCSVIYTYTFILSQNNHVITGLKLEVLVKKQDDVLKQPAAHICPSVKAAAIIPATPSTFPHSKN